MSALGDIVAALRAGAEAAQAGRPLKSCPWSPNAATASERAQARAWFRGYDRHRPVPVDFSG